MLLVHSSFSWTKMCHIIAPIAVKELLKNEKSDLAYWLARSPDIYPSNHAWDYKTNGQQYFFSSLIISY